MMLRHMEEGNNVHATSKCDAMTFLVASVYLEPQAYTTSEGSRAEIEAVLVAAFTTERSLLFQ